MSDFATLALMDLGECIFASQEGDELIKCVRCGKNPATVKLTRIIKGKVTELNLCQACAAEVSPYQKKLADAAGLNALIAHLVKAEQAKKAGETPETTHTTEVEAECPACGLNFATYKRTFMLGCEHCYEAFGDPLLTDLRKIHGSIQHLGRRPDNWTPPPPPPKPPQPPQKSIEQLRHELQQAIDQEDFERAARLRDQIRDLQDKHNPS